jgi:hypothetical protein
MRTWHKATLPIGGCLPGMELLIAPRTYRQQKDKQGDDAQMIVSSISCLYFLTGISSSHHYHHQSNPKILLLFFYEKM